MQYRECNHNRPAVSCKEANMVWQIINESFLLSGGEGWRVGRVRREGGGRDWLPVVL